MEPRTRHLLSRELDGELTPTERSELERRRCATRDLGREARAWQRVEAGLRSHLDEMPTLAVDRIAQAVARRAAQQQTRRPMVAAASLVLLGALALSQVQSAPHLLAPPRPALVPSTPRTLPPVEVRIEAGSEAGGLVKIDF